MDEFLPLFTPTLNNILSLEIPGEVFKLRKLMPNTMEHDFNIHVMDFEPGEYLNVKEVHYNQHGLWMRQVREFVKFVVVDGNRLECRGCLSKLVHQL